MGGPVSLDDPRLTLAGLFFEAHDGLTAPDASPRERVRHLRQSFRC